MNNGFVRRFQAARLLPEGATEELFRRYGEVLRVYPRNDKDQVASHNDLKPQNMRFDGERIRLVDWNRLSSMIAMLIWPSWRTSLSKTKRKKKHI